MARQIAIAGIVVIFAHLTSSSVTSNSTRREKHASPHEKIKRGVLHVGNGYGYEVYPVQSTPTFSQFSAFASPSHSSPYSVADFKPGAGSGSMQIKKPAISHYGNAARDSYGNQYQPESFQHSVPEHSVNLRPKHAQHLIAYAPQHGLISDQHPKVFQKYTQTPVGPTNAVLIPNAPLHNYNIQLPYQNDNAIRYPIYKNALSPQFPSQTNLNQYPKPENFQASPFQIKNPTNNLKQSNYYNSLENQRVPYLTQNVQYSPSPVYEVPKRHNPQVIISEQQPLHITFPSSSLTPMDEISENFKSIEPQYIVQQPYKNAVLSSAQNILPRLQESYDVYNQDNAQSQSKFPIHSQPAKQDEVSTKQLDKKENFRSGEDEFRGDELKEIFVDDERHPKNPENNEHRYYLENEELNDEDFVRSAHYDDEKYPSVVHNADKEPTYFDDYERFKSMGKEGKETKADPTTYYERYYHNSHDEIPSKYTQHRLTKTKHKDSSKAKSSPLKHSNSNPARKPTKIVATKSSKDPNGKDHHNFGDRPYSFNSLYTKSAPEMSLNIYNGDDDTHFIKGDSKFVKPKYQYGFEPIISGYKNIQPYHNDDSEGKYSSNHPMAVKKIYKENWYISKTIDD